MAANNVATLGLTVNSSQVTQATQALAGLAAAAAPAATAAAALTAAAAPANAALGTMAKATQSASHAHGGLSTNAMAAGHAVRSLAEGFAAGMPPTQILAQQLNHLSYAAAGPGGITGAFKEVGSALFGLIPTWALVAGGIGLVVGAGALFYNSIKNQEKALGDLGERTNTTIADLHSLQTAAALKGISSDEFTKGMERLGELTLDAQHGVGALAEEFRATGTAIGNTNQNTHSLADIMSRTAQGAEQYRLMVQLGLPTTREWVQFLAQGSDNIDKAVASVAKFDGDGALAKKAHDFDDAWNKAFINVSNYSKATFLDLLNGSTPAIEKVLGLLPLPGAGLAGLALRGIGNPKDQPQISSGGGGSMMPIPASVAKMAAPANPADMKQEQSMLQQRIGLLQQSASFTEVLTSKENELKLARLAGVSISDSEIKDIVEQTRQAKLGVTAIDSQTDALKVEMSALGMSQGVAAAYRAEKNQLNTFERYGIELTKSQSAELHKYAEALGAATQKAAELRMQQDQNFALSQLGRNDTEGKVADAMRQLHGDNYNDYMSSDLANVVRLNSGLSDLKSTSQGALSSFVKDLAQGKTAAQGLHDVLGTVESKLIDMASNAIISNLFKNLLGSVGGSIIPAGALSAGIHHSGGIVGLDSGPSRLVHPSLFAGAPRFHEGGIATGEIPAVLQKGEGVFTANQMRAMAPAGASNNVQVSVVNAAPGTQVQTNKRKDGNTDIHEITISAVGDAMASGRFDGVLRGRFGTVVQPRGR